jgi:glycosyltransferase involved in cell wall biosynthesis
MTDDVTRLRIAILGLWGMNVPGRHFGGFETAFSEIGSRLAARGHDVTIYCRGSFFPEDERIPAHDGVRLRYVASPGGKNFSAVTATLNSVLDARLRGKFDVLLFVNVGMGFHCALARALGHPVVLNVDGLDWKRRKWGPFARAYFRAAASAAVHTVRWLVTDARAMHDYYLEKFGADSTTIPYGTYFREPSNPARLREVGVEPGEYFLIVSRLVPENNLEEIIHGFASARTRRRLVVAGGTSFTDTFVRRLKARADSRVTFTGHVDDQELLDELWTNCYAYVHGHSVGGTNPALLRAMGAGAAIAAHDNVFNREVLGDAGIYFDADPASVARVFASLDGDPAMVGRLRGEAPERARERYSWEDVTERYEALLLKAAGRG